jgi:MerR family transcriptional regulator, light-induced transcriptional regulator
MGHYSIKDLEGFTGIKAHTLRIWEQRYNLLEPERTDTNIRLYNDHQLKVLLNAVMLYKNGFKISHIALLKEQGVKEAIETIVKKNNNNEVLIDALVVCMVNMDENNFEEIITKSISNIGFISTMIEVIYPFFERVGVLWLTDVVSISQEHFVSNLIRQKIIVAIDSLGVIKNPEAKTCLAFLHEEEMHEIGLLLYSYLFKYSGIKVIYLGQIVPYEDVVKSIQYHNPNYILTGFVKPMETNWIDNYLTKILSQSPNSKILTTGFQSSEIKIKDKNLHIIATIEDFKKVIEIN